MDGIDDAAATTARRSTHADESPSRRRRGRRRRQTDGARPRSGRGAPAELVAPRPPDVRRPDRLLHRPAVRDRSSRRCSSASCSLVFDYDRAEELFPFVLVTLVGPARAGRSRQAHPPVRHLHAGSGWSLTALVVVGVAALVLWYMVRPESECRRSDGRSSADVRARAPLPLVFDEPRGRKKPPRHLADLTDGRARSSWRGARPARLPRQAALRPTTSPRLVDDPAADDRPAGRPARRAGRRRCCPS